MDTSQLLDIIVSQLMYQSSNRNKDFAGPFGLFLYATGTARQTIDALFRCRLSISYQSLRDLIPNLGAHCMEAAQSISQCFHILQYDNLDLQTSVHVEQRDHSTPAKHTGGCWGTVDEVQNASEEDGRLQPINERLISAPPLTFQHDIRPTHSRLLSLESQLVISVVKVLLKYSASFTRYSTHSDLQYRPIRPLSPDAITDPHPTRVTTFDESTIKGNNQFLDDLYLKQLGHQSDDFKNKAIPTIVDQLTLSRLRSIKSQRRRDVDEYERRQPFQLGYGVFHAEMNFDWLLLHIHRGKASEVGSLAYWFSILNKKRLSRDRPDYHTLSQALNQVLDGILLQAWRAECGHTSLEAFAASKPSPQRLLNIAQSILQKYTDPIDLSESDEPSPADATPLIDITVLNTKRLMTHFLVRRMLQCAVRDGDFGRVEDLQPHLAMMFCGGGGKNYCNELLHFIHHSKYVWPEAFA
jgi:hypothetical protein